MIFIEQSVEDLTPSMSCSDIEDLQNAMVYLTTSMVLSLRQKRPLESQKVPGVSVDLLKELVSPSSKSKVQRESPFSYVTQLDVEIFVQNLLPLLRYKSKRKYF
jgi:hypothetical protein